MNLTEIQKKIYRYLCEKWQKTGVMPNTVEIQKAFGYNANSTVIQHLKALQKKGLIEIDSHQRRGIVLLESKASPPARIEVLGVVHAGPMIETYEMQEEILFPQIFLKSGGDGFALSVKGESMIGAGIVPGDIVFIERTPVARNGQIVVAALEGKMTLKRYFREGKKTRLQPENPEMEPILIEGDVEIIGVMTGLLRKV
ncbi:MAG: repressor LexA [Candidatus Cloacimonetes bacterium]|nr:repressor LexA [Candidatus Cloacimonadota bacterium]